ncbi:VOC family protein [Myxococcota bacterium]|nr:VOC family protein [Myxococcota bacterium]MBU1498791.1 VOC family protein [Myxococcota bacterium]
MNFSFITLYTNNIDIAHSFYTEIVGLKETRRFSPGNNIRIIFLSDGNHFNLELIENGENWGGLSDKWPFTMAFHTDSIEKTENFLKSKNISFEPPVHIPGGPSMIFIKDPDGVRIMMTTAQAH